MERNDWRLYKLRSANRLREGEAGTIQGTGRNGSIHLRRCWYYIGVGMSTKQKKYGFRAALVRGLLFHLRLSVSAYRILCNLLELGDATNTKKDMKPHLMGPA